MQMLSRVWSLDHLCQKHLGSYEEAETQVLFQTCHVTVSGGRDGQLCTIDALIVSPSKHGESHLSCLRQVLLVLTREGCHHF